MPSPPRSTSGRPKAPVFVLGCPRSGTTLLYHMLLSAGNFAVYRTESQVFNLLEPRFGDLSLPRNQRKMLDAWEHSDLFRQTGLAAGQIDQQVLANCRNAGDFLRIVMEAMARAQGVERWADCTPEHLLSLPRIKQTIPNALVIHIIRDGRDVALSLEKQKWIHPFPWDHDQGLLVAGLYWEWIVNQGREHGKALGPDYREIHYEQLVRNPRETLAQLGDFLEQELDHDHIQQVGIGSVRTPNSSFQPDSSAGEFNPIARWKASLSGEQLRDLDCALGNTLRELGYPVDTAGAEAPNRGALERMRGLYHGYFEIKHILKTKTPLGRWFASRDLSWV